MDATREVKNVDQLLHWPGHGARFVFHHAIAVTTRVRAVGLSSRKFQRAIVASE